jgi:hypothetical protein
MRDRLHGFRSGNDRGILWVDLGWCPEGNLEIRVVRFL